MKNTNGTTRTETQFSVFLATKPKTLSRICQRLADDKVNIVALSMMDGSEHSVLRLVVENPEQARESLAAVNVPTAETTVLVTSLSNHPGAMADVVERLASDRIAVSYAYCTAGAAGGKSTGVFHVSDFKKAAKVLSERKPRRKQATSTRAPAPSRRK